MLFEICLLLIFITLSAFFSGSETALMAISRLRLQHQVKKEKPKAKLIQDTILHPYGFLGTVLVGNNLVNTACAAVATGIALRYFEEGTAMFIATACVTVVLLIVSELLPKSYAAIEAEGTAYHVIYPLRFFMFILYPFVKVITSISNSILKFFGVNITKTRAALSEEELKTLIQVSMATGKISKEKQELLQGIFELDVRKVKNIMTPRNQIVMIELHDTPENMLQTIENTQFSRIPVYQEKKDNIIGVLNAKDFLRSYCKNKNVDIQALLNRVLYIPELQNIRHLVKSFQQNRTHAALVVNEFGGLEGFVTLEDALEEIVGEIYDEHD